jgi:hypothetical protein
MGNNNQKKNRNGIVQFDQPFYYPGNFVTGTIFLNILDRFNSRGVELDIKCIEGVSVMENHQRQVTQDGKTEYITEQRLLKDKQTLFQNKNYLPNFQNNISIGQYAYPFSFVIPAHLPGSFEYYTDTTSAFIKYEVKVKILPFYEKEETVKFSTILVVRQLSSFFNYPQNLTDTRKITTWCFFDQGIATLNVSYQKNYFAKDEIVQMQCNLDNTRCKIDSTTIRLNLIQKISLKIKGERRFFTRVIAQTSANERCVKFFNIEFFSLNSNSIIFLRNK